MKFEKIRIIPILILLFIIEPLFTYISPTYGSLMSSMLLVSYFIDELKKQNIKIENIKKMCPTLKDLMKYFLMAICFIIISALLMTIAQTLLYLLVGHDAAKVISESSESNVPIWSLFVSAVIIAPITEEFLFRGVILNKLKAKYNIYTGVFISSIIFSILHDNIIGSFIFAFVASILYAKTKNIIGPIIIHFFNNLICMIPSLIIKDSSVSKSAEILTEIEYFELIQSSFSTLVIFLIPILIYIFNNWSSLKDC